MALYEENTDIKIQVSNCAKVQLIDEGTIKTTNLKCRLY
jgi:hypothetical protein